MRFLKNYCLSLIVILSIGGCSLMLEPENDNHNTIERITWDPAFAEGLLMGVYNKIPSNQYSFNDVATDDAVSNDKFNVYLRMATGQWSAQYNPMSIWDNANKSILYLNLFIPQIDTIVWSWSNQNVNAMFKSRLKGEAYALRAMFRYYLLQSCAGKSTSGNLLGIPLFNVFLEENTSFNIPRASFTASIDSIYSDFDKAAALLPLDFVDISNNAQLPLSFANVNITDYNKVFGIVSAQRISKRIVLGLKARVALMAASPAYSDDDLTAWSFAANSTANVLNEIGGITGLDPKGNTFYLAAKVNSTTLSSDQYEILWRGATTMNNTLEKTFLPPSLNGNGRLNPTQNLVDAFPMKNGYPINNDLSTYNPLKPYTNRDPRLALYIIYNGAAIQGKIIKTAVGGGIDANDSLSVSTRTGYYLRKLIREDIFFLNDGSTPVVKKHFPVHIRYTELFLSYAEAANEAWGPTGTGTQTYSAKDVILAIRKRAGITQPDKYLNSITTKEEMRELIRNERRLELCFEGFRFWDMRRWGLLLSESAKGVKIDGTNYEYLEVEKRKYDTYMQYGPLPEQEVLKYPVLLQNAGW